MYAYRIFVDVPCVESTATFQMTFKPASEICNGIKPLGEKVFPKQYGNKKCFNFVIISIY